MNKSAQFEVNIDYLNNNIDKLFDYYKDYKYKIADLRSNAFGMGLYVVKHLAEKDFDYVFTNTLKEAIEVRKYNQSIPILINKRVDSEFIYDAINNNVTITIDSYGYLEQLNELDLKDDLKVHILVNNNANVIGLNEDELYMAYELIKDNKHLILEGLYTNITTYGIDDNHYYEQVSIFRQSISRINTEGLIVHGNEPIMYHKKLDYFNGIKFDVSLWGLIQNYKTTFISNHRRKKIESMYQENAFGELPLDLEVVFAITAIIERIITVPKDSLIGRNYIALDDINVAVIDAGHKDGITKALKVVVVNQEICDVLTDDIDTMYIKVSDDVSVGDKVYLISDFNNIDSVLLNLKTNRYYLLSILNTDLKRVYIMGDEEEELYY